MSSYSVWFSDEQIEAVDKAATERGFTRAGFIRKAISDALEEKDIVTRLRAIERSNTMIFAWLDTLTKALYVRIPTPPKELQEIAKRDGAELYQQHTQRVAQTMAGVK